MNLHTVAKLSIFLYSISSTNFALLQALNEMGEQHLPLEFVDGYVSEMSVSIPWSQLLSEASYVEVVGMRLTVQPRQRAETGTSMFESMWSSMTSSIQLAQECLQQDANTSGNAQPLEGVELFAQTIDSSKHFILFIYLLRVIKTFIFNSFSLFTCSSV